MNKTYSFLVALCVAATSLASCSRSSYSFNNKVPAYLGSEQVQVAAAKPAPAEVVVPASAGQVSEVAKEPAAPVVASRVAAKATMPILTKKGPLSTVQRLVVKHVVKQLDKIKANSQNAANVEHTAASKTGRAAIIALAGLVLILLGVAINGAFGAVLAVIGYIAFLVGLVLVVVHLVSGD